MERHTQPKFYPHVPVLFFRKMDVLKTF